jgi:hypothetical protein
VTPGELRAILRKTGLRLAGRTAGCGGKLLRRYAQQKGKVPEWIATALEPLTNFNPVTARELQTIVGRVGSVARTAQALGVKAPTVSAWVNGGHTIPQDRATDIRALWTREPPTTAPRTKPAAKFDPKQIDHVLAMLATSGELLTIQQLGERSGIAWHRLSGPLTKAVAERRILQIGKTYTAWSSWRKKAIITELGGEDAAAACAGCRPADLADGSKIAATALLFARALRLRGFAPADIARWVEPIWHLPPPSKKPVSRRIVVP